MRLFHFSDDHSIERLEPRAVKVPSKRKDGKDWLNGPLVWAIDEWHQPMYFFPRDCPRILIWRLPTTTPADSEDYFADSNAEILAYVEASWLDRIQNATLYRYELPGGSFENLEDAGMWVSRDAVGIKEMIEIMDLPKAMESRSVELKVMDNLLSLKGVWDTTLHASGIRLRNAAGW